MPRPLLILSDAPTSGSGLGRITRDLATRIHKHLPDVFRVGTLGYGGPFSRALGFPQYNLDMSDWVAHNLPEVWEDFCGDEKGTLLSVWDASRLLWLAHPEHCSDLRLRKWLQKTNPELWGYFPVDATGPNDKLTFVLGHTMKGYDRVLAYSKWAEDIIRRTCPTLDVTNLPHGIDTSVFYPRPRVQARHGFGQRTGAKWAKGKKAGTPMSIPDDVLLIGIVATNQTRKDWGLGFQTAAELAKTQKIMIWVHVDILEKHWSIPNLITDYGLEDSVVVSSGVEFPDDVMAWCYSACDCFLAVGLGEGFGYAAAESLACGTPVVAPNYGGAQFIPQDFLVDPVAYRLENPYNCVRPVMSVSDFAFKASQVGKAKSLMNGSLLPPRYEWDNLWEEWEAWFMKDVPDGDTK